MSQRRQVPFEASGIAVTIESITVADSPPNTFRVTTSAAPGWTGWQCDDLTALEAVLQFPSEPTPRGFIGFTSLGGNAFEVLCDNGVEQGDAWELHASVVPGLTPVIDFDPVAYHFVPPLSGVVE